MNLRHCSVTFPRAPLPFNWKRICWSLALASCFGALLHAADDTEKRLQAASETISEIMGAGDKSIPADLFHKAQCAVIIPSMKQAGFIFSGKYGRGFASCRKAGGGWTGPAGMRVEGGGFGLQIGGEGVDVIMLVMSQKGMNGLLASKFTLGGEASVAAGPVGRDVTAQTDATMHADILSWSRARGVFGGISLEGGTLHADADANKVIYGKEVANADVLAGKAGAAKLHTDLSAKLAQYGGSTAAK